MIVIVDYGVGNLFSIQSSLCAIGCESLVTGRADDLAEADKIILPGVGAFGDAMAKLRAGGLDRVLISQAEAGKPLLGLCLGMQLLLEEGFEFGRHAGLGLIAGRIVPLEGAISPALKIPHIGWNALHFGEKKHPMFRYVKEGSHVYFVHSYHAVDCPDVSATCEYGQEIVAAVAKDKVWGCQFHPEKSGSAGLNVLRAFCEVST
jgi:glutamine amidotransferase